VSHLGAILAPPNGGAFLFRTLNEFELGHQSLPTLQATLPDICADGTAVKDGSRTTFFSKAYPNPEIRPSLS